MMLPSRLGCPFSLKTPNMINAGLHALARHDLPQRLHMVHQAGLD